MYWEWIRKDVILECAITEKKPLGQPMSLMIQDSQINSDQILEDINNLLNSGDIPNLFFRDDKEKIQKEIIGLYATKNISLEITEAWKIFIESIRNNLHIVLCMSPVGEAFKVWCR